jgi:predicted lipoprotein with Yx(FWY)xxD motif
VRNSLVMVLAPAIALFAAGCGSSNSSTSSTKSSASTTAATSAASSTSSAVATGAPQISTRTVPKLGTVLVNAQGRTLYVFAPDKAKKVTCVGACASVWPPLKLSGAKPAVSGQAKSSLASSDPNPAGGRVVTYAGWPLYNYVADPSPGTVHGEGVNLNGGLWYVITPSGKVITKKRSGSASTGGSGY